MPGVLKRSHDLVDPEDDATGLGDGKQRPSKRQATGMTNGDIVTNGLGLVNGGRHHEDVPGAPVEMLSSTIQDFAKNGGPPELQHVDQGFVPFRIVVERIAQETHNTMEELIMALSDPEFPPTYEKDDRGHDILSRVLDDANTTKKNRLWDFAQLWRSKFIKLMVLSQWSRNAAAVSKIIDIHNFIFTQRMNYGLVLFWMKELKRILVPDKLPAPDLKTAIEVLTTGKVAGGPNVSPVSLVQVLSQLTILS